MSKVAHNQTNFTSGELSPRLQGRVDVEKYFNGADQIQNFIVLPFGGIERTPGTRFVGEVRDSSEAARLIPFSFSTTQTYMLELNSGKMRFYRNQGRIVEASVVITDITQVDSAVVTAVAHGYSNGEYVIITGVVGMTEVNGREFLVANATTDTFQINDRNTTVGIDASGYTAYVSGGTVERIYEITIPWLEADLPDLKFAQTADIMYIVHPDYEPRKLSRTGHTSWTLAKVSFLDGPYLPANLTATTLDPSSLTESVTVVASVITGINDDTGFQSSDVGRLILYNDGTDDFWLKITARASTTSVTATIQYKSGDPDTTTMATHAATTSWSLGAWSDTTGYPRAVQFYEQRLVFAGTTDNPQTCWLSISEVYEDMRAGTADADALIYTIATDQVNVIRWLIAGKVLSLGTSGGIFSLSSGSNADPLTPTNVVVKHETTFGSSTVAPSKIGNYTYYVQRDTKTLREFAYSFDIDSYNAINMTILSDHITSGGIVEMAYQQSPNNVLYCVRGDGKLATLTREIDQQVAGWSEQTINGSYENIGIIPAATYDEVWFVVNRTINGLTTRFIEYQVDPRQGDTADLEDMVYMDSSLEYSGAAATILTGLDHLEGEAVAVLADGIVVTGHTIASGSITLVTAASTVQIGLANTPMLKLLPIEAGSSIGSAQGMKKRVNLALVRYFKSAGFVVGEDGGNTENVFSDDTTLQTDDAEVEGVIGWDKKQQLYLTQLKPLPVTILLLTLFMTTSEK